MRLLCFSKLDLILRRPRSGRLEGWAATPICDSRYQAQASMRPVALQQVHRWPEAEMILTQRSYIALLRSGDLELLDPATCLQSGNQPSRLFATSRPGFRRYCRISIFRENPGIMATRAFAIDLGRLYLDRNRSLRDFSAVKLNQPAFQLAFLRHNPLGQDRGELLVKGPQKIKRHRLKFRFFHGRSTTFPIRVQYNILRTILRSIHLPSLRTCGIQQEPSSFRTAFSMLPAFAGHGRLILDHIRRWN